MDVFSLGCTIFELYRGIPLFPILSDIRIIFAYVEKVVGWFTPTMWERVKVLHKDLFMPTLPVRVQPIARTDWERGSNEQTLLMNARPIWVSSYENLLHMPCLIFPNSERYLTQSCRS